MINPGNGSRWGIKPSGTDLTADIHEIIDNAYDFIVVCGYNFSPYSHPTSIIPKLIARKNAGVDVLLIAPPIMWGFGNTNHTNNLQYLVNNGIGVILNSFNHSKWLITDYGYYYGSLNFTAASMTSKVEVVSLCNVLYQSGIPAWMNLTKQELLQFAVTELNNFNTQKATNNLGAVNAATLTKLQGIFYQILRYNPEIEKVIKTLLNYEDVRLKLSSIIDDYYPIVDFISLDKIWRKIVGAVFSLDKLAYSGNDILIKSQSHNLKGFNIIGYNRIHDSFKRRIESISEIANEKDLKSFRQDDIIESTKKTEIRIKEFIIKGQK